MNSTCIRPLSLAETQELLSWAREEGWNPGLVDAECFYAADREGFMGCFVDGRLAAGISAVRYGEDFGFIGLYICHPDFRGQGLGRRVWDRAMEHLEGRTIGLDGVPAQQHNYAKMGFEPHYRTWRWTGRLQAPQAKTTQIVSLDDANMALIRQFDQRAFGHDRQAFLKKWLHSPHTTLAFAEGREITGYGTLRKCHDGFKIGPLFAENDEVAAALIVALSRNAGGDSIIIDVPELKVALCQRLEAMGFTRNFVTARMYRGAPPRLEERLVYGVTTLELG